MSESSPSNPSNGSTQRQRWLKYGGNVALTCLIVIALAVMVTYASEKHPVRIDTTTEGLYSLKPQTLRIIRDINTPIRIVSLYTHSKPPQSPDEDEQAQQAVVPADEAAQTVNDLLDEYANKGKNITVETIDPVTSPSKVDDLIEQVEGQYGGEIQKYKKFVDSFKETIDSISKIADPEAKTIESLLPMLQQSTDQDLITTVREVLITVGKFPSDLADLQDSLQRPLRQKPPDYKGASDAITQGLGSMSDVLGAVINNFGVLQKRGGLPDGIAMYMKESLPHYQDMKKVVDDSLAQAKVLGELKLDTLRSALRERNTILVMGDKEWRAINYDQVWQPPGRMAMQAAGASPRPRFAGEQQVTAAILGLTSGGAKPKVCIVRAGGAPLAQSESFMGGPDAPLSDAVGRLALYNYDVTEKDLTGAFAQQSGGTEPSDDDIKDATWIVWAFRSQAQSQFGPPPGIGPQVAEHLKQGGSAVIITGYKQDPMVEALGDWGVEVNTNAILVHQKEAPSGANSNDMLEQALGKPFIFAIHAYGDQPLAKPLSSLESVFVAMSPVIIHPTTGYQATPLLPIPTAPDAPPSWASTTFDPQSQSDDVTYDPKSDISGPLFGGAAVEKKGGGRVVVLSAGDFANNELLELTSQMFDPNAPPVIRFPGNGELFTNSVFWASHQDTLIDISPAAMDIGRIGDMTPGVLKFWRVGVLIIGLPGLVLVAGAGVYLKRRD